MSCCHSDFVLRGQLNRKKDVCYGGWIPGVATIAVRGFPHFARCLMWSKGSLRQFFSHGSWGRLILRLLGRGVPGGSSGGGGGVASLKVRTVHTQRKDSTVASPIMRRWGRLLSAEEYNTYSKSTGHQTPRRGGASLQRKIPFTHPPPLLVFDFPEPPPPHLGCSVHSSGRE